MLVCTYYIFKKFELCDSNSLHVTLGHLVKYCEGTVCETRNILLLYHVPVVCVFRHYIVTYTDRPQSLGALPPARNSWQAMHPKSNISTTIHYITYLGLISSPFQLIWDSKWISNFKRTLKTFQVKVIVFFHIFQYHDRMSCLNIIQWKVNRLTHWLLEDVVVTLNH